MNAYADQFGVERTGVGVRYVLPRRALGKLRWVGLVLIGFGLMFSGFAVSWILRASGVTDSHDVGGVGWVFAAFGIPFVIAGLFPINIGLLILRGWCEVELTDKHLIARERGGIWPHPRKRKLDRVRTLRVVGAESQVREMSRGESSGELPGVVKQLAAVKVECESGQPMMAVLGYPAAVLHDLATTIADRLGARGPAKLFDDEHDCIAVVDDTQATDPVERDERMAAHQPAASTAEVDDRPDGLTITLAPAGLRKGSKGLFTFAIAWNIFVAFFLVMMGLSEAGVLESDGGEPMRWFVWLFMLPFVAVGMGTLLAAINMGRRRTIIDVVGATLLISRAGPFGVKQRDWPADQLDDIRVGPSGMKVNNRHIMELQIHPARGRKYGLLSERDDAELEWLAATLRRRLQLNPTPHS